MREIREKKKRKRNFLKKGEIRETRGIRETCGIPERREIREIRQIREIREKREEKGFTRNTK